MSAPIKVFLRPIESPAAERPRTSVHCPKLLDRVELGVCLGCTHYRGTWFGSAGHCAIKCAYEERAVTDAASSATGA
jgi:hypothetical protein